jgi:hypothetical protein
MKDGKNFELPVIDLTGEDSQPSRTPELIDLTEDSSTPTKVSASQNSSMQVEYVSSSVFNDGPIVLDIEDNCVTNDIIAVRPNVLRNLECNRRTSNNAASKTYKSQTKSPEIVKLNNVCIILYILIVLIVFICIKISHNHITISYQLYECSSVFVAHTQPAVEVIADSPKVSQFHDIKLNGL